MLKDGAFVQNEITESNIKALSRRQITECEKRICELSELAEECARAALALSSEGYGIYEILGLILEGIALNSPDAEETLLPENQPRVSTYLSSLNANDRAVFSELLADYMSRLGIEVLEEHFLDTLSEDETFVYVKNRLADEAYDVFSQNFSSPTVSYAHSFKEAARAVSSGKAEYCLLPLEEHGGARLPSIAAILFAEDLKINTVTPVFGFDGSADMKYALVSRHFTVPAVKGDDDRYLELRIEDSTAAPISELLTAARQLGVSVYRINSISFDTEDGEIPFFSIVFKKNGADFISLLVYLTLFCSSYTAIGIYNNLE
ncbi:MAG: hypothetical protein IJ515_02560 [Clostridia bacterium]|nr:hypothetical protein [Clostridia bacterium]